jgi:hypothetical protein
MVVAFILAVIWLFYQAKRANECDAAGGAYVKTFGGYSCIEPRR